MDSLGLAGHSLTCGIRGLLALFLPARSVCYLILSGRPRTVSYFLCLVVHGVSLGVVCKLPHNVLSIYVLYVVSECSIPKYDLIYTTMLTCLLGANPPPGRNEASLESRAECK